MLAIHGCGLFMPKAEAIWVRKCIYLIQKTFPRKSETKTILSLLMFPNSWLNANMCGENHLIIAVVHHIRHSYSRTLVTSRDLKNVHHQPPLCYQYSLDILQNVTLQMFTFHKWGSGSEKRPNACLFFQVFNYLRCIGVRVAVGQPGVWPEAGRPDCLA